jgi:PAS domain S-box-containing protein
VPDVHDDDLQLLELPEDLQQQLRDSETPTVAVDREGVIVFVNGATTGLLGYDPDDLVGDFVEALVPSDMKWGHARYRMGFFAEPSPREMAIDMEPVALHKDGSKVPIHVQLRPHDVGGSTVAIAEIRAAGA